MKIYYVRHGQTDWNLAQKMQGGESEKDLNATGIKQAQKTKRPSLCRPWNTFHLTATEYLSAETTFRTTDLRGGRSKTICGFTRRVITPRTL